MSLLISSINLLRKFDVMELFFKYLNGISSYLLFGSILCGRNVFKLFGQSDNSTSNPGSGISSFERFLIVALPKIILILMDDNSSAHDWVFSKQRDDLVFKAHVGVTKWIWNQIAQISNMPFLVEGSSVIFLFGVKMSPSCCASISQISILMNMDSMLAVRIKAFNNDCNFDGAD